MFYFHVHYVKLKVWFALKTKLIFISEICLLMDSCLSFPDFVYLLTLIHPPVYFSSVLIWVLLFIKSQV